MGGGGSLPKQMQKQEREEEPKWASDGGVIPEQNMLLV